MSSDLNSRLEAVGSDQFASRAGGAQPGRLWAENRLAAFSGETRKAAYQLVEGFQILPVSSLLPLARVRVSKLNHTALLVPRDHAIRRTPARWPDHLFVCDTD